MVVYSKEVYHHDNLMCTESLATKIIYECLSPHPLALAQGVNLNAFLSSSMPPNASQQIRRISFYLTVMDCYAHVAY